ncbi:MAG TPA: choice-of-anchor D domain-containing protein [Kiritimatiellia bacterium]|nr:choice-of-anchor D domain-containing protein [Kiritimatiellia bacterium]
MAGSFSSKTSNDWNFFLENFQWLEVFFAALAALMPNMGFAWGWAVRDTARQSSENPTIYLGDSIEFHWDVNADGWGATYKKAGAGTVNNSGGMNWQNLTWVDEAGDGYGGNEGIKSASFQGTSVATWYYSLWLGWGGSIGDNGHWYNGSSSWNEGSGSFVSSSFTVSALGNPTGVSAARDATYPTSRVDLSWTEWNNRNVLIVRRKGSSVAWTPTQGTAYSDGQSLGSDTYVVENSRDGGSFEDTGIGTALEAGTLYYYKVYSENYSYYSSGTEVSVRTRPNDATWDGGGADNNTLTEANWNNDLYPAASANSVMRFAGSTRTTPSVTHAANSDFGSIYFNSGASAFTLSGNAVDIFSLIQNDSANAQTIQNALALNGTVSLSTVSGNLNLNGVLSGSYGIKKTGTATAAITNANTFTGGAWVEKGTLQLGGHTNAMGSGAVSVGTNATLDLTYGSATLRPVALNLYNGQVTKATSSATTWRGALNSYNSSTVSVSSGNFYVYGGMNLASGTLVFNNANQGGMSGGTMTGSGHLTKLGSGVFQLRPGTHSGNIALSEGEIRQYTGTMTASGTLTLSGGTRYSSDGSTTRTITKDVVINGGVGIAENSTGGITISGAVGLGGGTRTITNSNTLTVSGVVSDGGLEKKDAGTMILSGNNSYASGTTITEGTLQIGDNGTSGSVVGNIVNNSALVFNRSDNLTYGGGISGTGTLDKQGAGALTLTNTSTYSGNTTITAGTLIQNGTNSSSAVAVSSGTSLVGGGGVGGLTVTGSVYPGTSAAAIGRLTVTSLTMNDGSAAYFQIGDCDNTSDRDYISNSGSATINATTTIYIDDDEVSNWDNAGSYSWNLITGGILDASNFTLDESLWALDKAGGSFALSASGGNLVLTFTPSAVPVAEINVLGTNSVSITDGDTTPALADGTDYGLVLVAGGTKDHTFKIENTGTADLTVSGVTTTGTHAADYTVISWPGIVNPSASSNLIVRFDPSSPGPRTATLHVNSDDDDEADYDFVIQGTGTYVEISVSGNSQYIADGDGSPTTDDHTDFGPVGTIGATQDRIFTISNTGNVAMGIGNVTTSGTHEADFTVTEQPSSPLAPSNTTTFTVRFDPSATGLRSAALSFTNTDDNVSDGLAESPFNFSIQGTGVAPAITNYPGTLSFSSVLGSAPAVQSFSVTNIGLGSMSYSLTTNASWLTLKPVSGTVAGGAGQVHTAVVAVAAGQQPGVSNATITITAADATNSPRTIAVSWTISAIPDPSVATAAADGKTMIDLAWTKHASYDVMIVYRAGSASTAPSQGTSYSVGSACGSGTVIYKGSGSALEHVVASGVTHHYAFYSYNGNYYSSGLTDSDTTTAFAAGEIVETFSYTSGVTLASCNGSNLWGGAWYGDPGLFTNSAGSFSEQANYPAPSGNKVLVTPANDANVAVYRALDRTYNNGRIYFGYVMNYQYEGGDKYSGLSLYWNNTEEKLFIGEIGAADRQLGIDSTGSSVTLTNGAGNDYIIVGYYDWSAGEARAKAYRIGSHTVPTDEPSSWDVTVSKASNSVGWVNSIRLAAGEFGGGSGTPGDCYFDEIRISTNWAGLLQAAPSTPDDPSSQSATADGYEMVRLGWTKNGSGNSVLILHDDSAIATDPTDGNSYSVGDSIGAAKVIYKGSDTAAEHIVEDGSDNYYKFYSYNGANYYSDGVTADVSMGSYASYENVNPFSYTNNTAFGTSMKGGQGFGANYWAANSGTWKAQTNTGTATADTPKFFDLSGYPDMAGNLAWVENPGDGGSATADRDIDPAINSGTFYVAFMMSYQYYGSNKWAGLSLMNSGTEKAFFGKGSGGNWSTLAAVAEGTTYWSAYDLAAFAGGGGNTGNVYLVVGRYDFGTKEIKTKAWRVLDSEFPDTEPESWDASGTLSTGIDAINRIRLNVGSSSAGAGTIGRVFFDEIRYATNWAGLIAVTCPTWAGSNTLGSTSTWLGDTESFEFQSYPVGLGQTAGIEFDWSRDGSFSSYYDTFWWKNENSNSYWTNQVQMISAGVVTSRFVASGSGCTPARTNNQPITVQNLNPPTDAAAVQDGTFSNSQINLTWTRGVSGGAKDTLVVRQTADSGWTVPVNGTTYNANDSLGSGTVVYRGALEEFDDTGLSPDTTYYYRFYAENWTYYSTNYDEASAATAGGSQELVIDGGAADWLGTPATVYNASAGSLGEFIWTDKKGELRVDSGDHPNGDISEFRVFADEDWVYFLVKMTNITDEAKPYVVIGVDTRRNSASAGMNWLGDDSGLFAGGDYFGGGAAAVHYAEYQLNIHSAGGGAKIEMYAKDGAYWYAPPTGGDTNVAISTSGNAVELKVARADLGLTGDVTGRFTVASFLNTGAWNNDGDGTVHIADNTADAIDSMSIAPYNTADNSASLSAWLEDISDADIDFWLDVKFSGTGISANSKASTPVLVSPTNTAATSASPQLVWNKSTDSDGEVTGYLLEISTNEQFNGVTGTENGTIQLRVNLDANTTNYTFTTSASQYWWRVRARDTAGELSSAATRSFRVVGKLDTEGPLPTLLYIGTNVTGYLAGDYDTHIATYGYIQSVLDSEIRDTNNVFGFVIQWSDASGVYATNQMKAADSPPNGAGGFAFNIVDTDGRVSPNWDLVEIDTVNGTTNDLWGVDRPFYTSNTLAAGNGDLKVTNYVPAAFTVTNYDPSIAYYLTLSAEDSYTEGGSWWDYGSWPSFASSAALPYYSGWCEDGPNTMRNITTNYLIEVHVTDDDIIAPVASTDLAWENDASMTVSNSQGALAYVGGSGQDVLYQITDGSLIGDWLTFSFNAYESYYSGIALGTSETFSHLGRTLTNTAFVAAYWQTNWANYSSSRSQTSDTLSADTMITWYWPTITTQDVTKLWGPESLSGEMGVTNIIQLDLYDTDNDRAEDQASARVNFGRVRLVDDDASPPTLSLTSIGGLSAQNFYTESGEMMYYDFGTGDTADLQPARIFTSLSVADLTVLGVTPATAAGESGNAVSYGYWNTATSYWEFAVTVQDGFRLTVQTIRFGSRATSTGPTDWALKYSGDGYASDLASGSLNNNGSFETISASLTSVTNTGAVTFRLYGSGASSYAGTWRLDNLSYTGKIATVSGTYLATDGDLHTNGLVIKASAQDSYSGLYAITSPDGPSYDLISPAEASHNNAFGAGPAVDGSPTNQAVTLADTNGYPYADIVLGTYTAVVQVMDYDVDRDGDGLTVAVTGVVTVVDDDTGAPKYSTARGTYVFFDGVSAGSEGNAVTDGMLTNGLSITNRLYDEKSGILSTSVQFRLLDPIGWDSGLQDFTTGPADGESLTNKFADDTVVSVDGFDVDLQNRSLGVWTTLFYATDFDLDRPGDVLSTTQSLVMYVVDDDKLGPRMTNFLSMGSAGVLIASGFEVIDGWEAHSEGNWTEEAFDGTWTGSNMYVNTLNGRGPEGTTAGYNAGFNDVNDSLQMPPVDGPGWVVLWAKLSAEGESKMMLEWLDDSTWTSAGELSITSTGYFEYAWTVGMTNAGVSLRLRMTEKTTGNRSIYIDDIAVVPVRPWTNSAVSLAWEASSDADTGDSGIDEYRVVGLNAGAPLYTTNGAGVSALSTSVAPAVEGVVTGYVFAVDADLDRGSIDRTMGLAVPYILKIDTTPPAQIVVTNASEGPDDTSEIRIGWNPAADAGNPALSPWKSYVVFYTDDGGTADTNDMFIYVDSGGPSVLGDIGTREVILSNFVNGSTYNLAVAGLDEAGNMGPLGGFTNVTLAVLSVTQSLAEVDTVVTNGVHVSFTATNSQGIMNRKIDVLYADSLQFVEALTNEWTLLGLADSTSFLIDTGQVSGVPPRQLGANMMRFYRAASQNNWLPARNPRSASVEIFGVKPVTLYPGQNWISLPFWPTRQNILHVLGRSLPAGTTGGDEQATRVSWYDRNNGGWLATQEVALIQSSPTSFWLYTEGGGGGDGNDAILPLHEAFVIELPTNAAPQTILLTGRVPTNSMVQTVRAMHNSVPGRNLVSFNAPRYLHPSQMGLLEAGFQGGAAPIWSDQIWKYDRSGQFAPYPVWFRTSDNTWRHTHPFPFPPVASNYFGPDDGIFIHTRASTSDWSWTNKILYKLPTSRMDL